jgi:hypothetical protein
MSKSTMPVLEPAPRFPRIAPRLSIANGLHVHADDPRWQLAQRIAASESIGRSRLLADFLLYIVDRHIRNLTDEISEQQIGVLVFGRAEGYDSNEDNIVRGYARNLRKRLDEYFVTEGREETLLLRIPRGGYTPIFSDAVKASEEVEIDNSVSSPRTTEPQEPETSKSSAPDRLESPSLRESGVLRKAVRLPHIPSGMLLGLVVGIALGIAAMLLRYSSPIVSREEEASHRLWSQLFSGDRDTFIVPSDVGLVIMQRLIERPMPLATYVDGKYRSGITAENPPSANEILKLGERRFTNVVDLDFAAHLAQLREVVPGRMMIRYARDLRMDDLRTNNAILIGSDEANPWIELFHPQLHFSFRFESEANKESGFVNLYPRTGERAVYSTNGHEEQTFGIIAYLPNLNNNGHVLIVAGLNTAGTQAAAAFVLNPTLMMPTLLHARMASGVLQPFELVIGADNVAANASTPHVVAERIGLPRVQGADVAQSIY